ncbi:hypothetical protein ASE16_18025 [Leifsonia sp. Root227]|uniref:DUF6325 family protein n=1 Tax=unclassified Leifsonia TaxID=2663824 RepID=UPI0006FDACFD|nr:DUF6325 family protein [Leifsonia sp. Root227]KRC47225.1 hypothetical protein ASE16_18025 [Leifsonia sp. Root227]
MTEFEYGPAEFIVAQFEGERPSPGVIQAIVDLVGTGTVRLLDLLFVSRSLDGDVEIVEFEDAGDEYGLTEITLEASGIAGSEDVDDIADLIDPGTSGAILVLEHTWAKDLASKFFAAGGNVVHAERIPAPVVNAVLAEASEE